MVEDTKNFKLQTKSGKSLSVGEVNVTPLGQSLTVRCKQGGWVLNRPRSLVVQREETKQTMPILDVTRILQLVLYSLSALFMILGFIFTRHKKEKNNA